MGLPSDAYSRWCAYVAGVCCYVAADFILAWAGDTLYRTARIEGKDGFVTFERLPANWQAQLAKSAEPAEPAAPTKAGPLHYCFLAVLGLAVAGACVALGGTAAVQQYCSANGYVIYGSGYQWRPCSPYWSLPWFVWALIVAFLAITGLAYAKRQIHNYRASLWSLAAITCALSCLICFMTYAPLDYIQDAALLARYRATLAGFATYTGATLLLIVLGDALYRLKRVEGADGFVSFKRPAAWGATEERAPAAPRQPLRPIEWAFLASVALAAAGTAIALGGLASAQALCNQGGQQGNFMGIQEDCAVFLSWPWFGWALQVAVLAAVLAAWATVNIHSYKQSLWALAAVVIFTARHAGNKLFNMQPYSTGTLHTRQIVALWGFIILIAGDYLMAITLDAVHMLRREEGADGYLTFKRPAWPAPPAQAAAASADV
ncbi:hypothetical protein C2E21_7763 [Chlorella sorokiniana]|uniref:Uncharacterized protein n=1 Tax=Chlorella sorokiniana TaxID=3076 RepID=A0A2P6TGD6_CHLSO|nr:hypothetical protein C2E21_7763 [Chlorella sorokiniana]|eukprot:PRW33179.1 hypothetical protein C2E21_7763 [Chlorella sorokiniana]